MGTPQPHLALAAAPEGRAAQAPDRGLPRQPERQTHGGARVRGYDAGKKVNGRKRHILVDTLGLLLAGAVTAADVQDGDGARLLLGGLPGGCKKLRKVWGVERTFGWLNHSRRLSKS